MSENGTCGLTALTARNAHSWAIAYYQRLLLKAVMSEQRLVGCDFVEAGVVMLVIQL